MGKPISQILVFITSDDKRVLGGDPLTLLVTNDEEKEALAGEMGRALKADVIQLKNGDYMLINYITSKG